MKIKIKNILIFHIVTTWRGNLSSLILIFVFIFNLSSLIFIFSCGKNSTKPDTVTFSP